ncbi:conserved membrane hypothetical protein [Nostocoides australiense Ben110]|uniref:SdpI/YhfL protein family n=2 Tax=Nostocoides australiense TaxID=99480 RepID=W6K3A1_9MICO|nr:conserved membrane hypothetical protein [Tetrasphaera australiensis Ben110]
MHRLTSSSYSGGMGWVGFALNAAIGALMLVCVLKIRNGTLHRNAFMGIRVQATSVSEEAWDAAHRVAVNWWSAAAGVALAAAAGFLIAAVIGASDEAVGPWYMGVLVAVTALILVPAPRAIRAAKAVTQTD